MTIQQEISTIVLSYLNICGQDKGILFTEKDVLINTTPSDFIGDYTIVLFPFIKKLGVKPDELAEGISTEIKSKLAAYQGHNLVKGFLNIQLSSAFWSECLKQISDQPNFGIQNPGTNGQSILIEYPSPNTNKPLHLGHLRNIFLGSSLANILEANGYKVFRTCLYNDRGTNISKSMWAYNHSDDKKTPTSSGIKGDHLVGDYYVQFANEYKAEIKKLIDSGLTEEEAKKHSKLEKEIAELTVQWELKIPEVVDLWKTMNGWFYEGVKKTYDRLGLAYDKEYYESEVYNRGRETVEEGLNKGIFYQKEDSSVWIDLSDVGLDQKLVLRSNGTTVYITQDIALVYQKQKDFNFQRSVYVVGNEQEYHFKVLFEILKRLGLKGSEHLFHLSYGMVELPTGKMKSREGTVVDADDLIDEVLFIAKEKADEQGKLAEVSNEEKEKIYEQIGLGALRYYLLRVDPVKKMVYNPAESIDFNGNTAPFIQYIYARTQSLHRNSIAQNIEIIAMDEAVKTYLPNLSESKLIRTLLEFPHIIREAGENYSPALVANYVYQVASEFSTFYHDFKVLKEDDKYARSFRFHLSQKVGSILHNGLKLLCIETPERM
jgi:arginyl-tRNA synthetase